MSSRFEREIPEIGSRITMKRPRGRRSTNGGNNRSWVKRMRYTLESQTAEEEIATHYMGEPLESFYSPDLAKKEEIIF